MANEKSIKNEKPMTTEQNTDNECFMFLLKNKVAKIIIEIIIILMGSLIPKIYEAYKNIPETIQNINNIKNQIILDKKETLK